MAIIDKKGGIHGTAGSVVYRTYRGMNLVQGRPGKRKQTATSIRSACEFGLGSSAARMIRTAFSPLYQGKNDGTMVNRLTSAVSKSIGASGKERGERDLHDGDVSFLNGFSFNAKSPLFQYLQIRPEVSLSPQGQLTIKLPSMKQNKELLNPFGSQACRFRLRFLLVAINFKEDFYEYVDLKTVTIDGSERLPGQELIFEGEWPKGCMLLLGALLEYQGYNLLDECYETLNSKNFCPCEIITAIPARDEAEEGYAKQRYEQLPRETRHKQMKFYKNYEGPLMHWKVDKLGGKGRTGARPPFLGDFDTGARSSDEELDNLKGTRTSFPE
ncbi:hypothetical protein [Arcticibacter sp. MXS-1]|uniref:hypothetical protein n=1 Tax=Arcticibacter sp. MXS-1 TaxID=3341726 RepID=UPI0035A8BB53